MLNESLPGPALAALPLHKKPIKDHPVGEQLEKACKLVSRFAQTLVALVPWTEETAALQQ